MRIREASKISWSSDIAFALIAQSAPAVQTRLYRPGCTDPAVQTRLYRPSCTDPTVPTRLNRGVDRFVCEIGDRTRVARAGGIRAGARCAKAPHQSLSLLEQSRGAPVIIRSSTS